MGDVADNLLNDKGRVKFLESFYCRIGVGQFLTHEILNCVEKNLAELIQKDEYRK